MNKKEIEKLRLDLDTCFRATRFKVSGLGHVLMQKAPNHSFVTIAKFRSRKRAEVFVDAMKYAKDKL